MFLEKVLSIETIQAHQTNIELKGNLDIFKDNFSSMTDPEGDTTSKESFLHNTYHIPSPFKVGSQLWNKLKLLLQKA